MAIALQGAMRAGRFLNSVVFGRSNLLVTNALISTAMGALGDCIQQHYDLLVNSSDKNLDIKDSDDPKKNIRELVAAKPASDGYNWTRTLHMSACGLTTGTRL